MKQEQVKQMSDEQLRIKVAELLGWEWSYPGCGYLSERPSDWVWFHQFHTTFLGCGFGAVPNYTSDLNACHEMEEALDGYRLHDYLVNLGALTQEPGIEEWWAAVHATARQRCEAFVLTMEVGK